MADSPTQQFSEIYTQHIAIVWKTVHAFALTKEDRDDLFQEILMSLWEAIPEFEGRAKLSTYVYRVAHRRALNWKRSQRRYDHRLARYENELPALSVADSDPAAHARLDWLYRAINTLKPVDRTLCLLYLDGLAHREMAEILGLSEDNISIRVHRCKQQLAQILERTRTHEEL
jgi:RNA polymerase sigma-70 factor (ECF subfamily)